MNTVQDRDAIILPIASREWYAERSEYAITDSSSNTGEVPYSERYPIGRE